MREFEIKRDLFLQELKRTEFDEVFERIDSEGATIFRALQDIKNGRCVVLVVIDDSIYNTVTYTFAKLEDEDKKTEMLKLLNQLNQTYKALHFFIDDENQIVATFSYTSIAEGFNGDILLTMTVNLFKLIEKDEYSKIMKVMWS